MTTTCCLGADRQQQFRRFAALEPGLARSPSRGSIFSTALTRPPIRAIPSAAFCSSPPRCPTSRPRPPSETFSVQPWNQYGTKNTYVSSQTSASVGDRDQRVLMAAQRQFSGRLSAAADLHDQCGRLPRARSGTIPALNKQGVVADVVGTGALLHTQQTTANLKLAYDFAPTVRAPIRSASGTTTRIPGRRPI